MLRAYLHTIYEKIGLGHNPSLAQFESTFQVLFGLNSLVYDLVHV
jgi:hypothetical protein